ncbi:hypothetical protein [Corynebacterium sp.]|uniref:hypothetical protein n=1 Tax=Corynebacterium sp. TaxID=1720 RepID=UPI0028AEA918|nr:hypothetical protein [Corynebacterium sp.]
MPSKHLRTALWTTALVAIIVAGIILDSRGAAALVGAAITLIALALWIELSERIDDDT